jgi:hypothetical protein
MRCHGAGFIDFMMTSVPLFGPEHRHIVGFAARELNLDCRNGLTYPATRYGHSLAPKKCPKRRLA